MALLPYIAMHWQGEVFKDKYILTSSKCCDCLTAVSIKTDKTGTKDAIGEIQCSLRRHRNVNMVSLSPFFGTSIFKDNS